MRHIDSNEWLRNQAVAERCGDGRIGPVDGGPANG